MRNKLSQDNVSYVVNNTGLADCVRYLINAADLELFFTENPALFNALINKSKSVAADAIISGNEHSLYELHRSLFELYNMNIREPRPGQDDNHSSAFLISVRNTLEGYVEQQESKQVEKFDVEHLDGQDFLNHIKEIWKSNSTPEHEIFHFMEHKANRAQFNTYFKNDYMLNIRFYDLIVYSLIGIDEEVRPEVAENFWDEVGKGNPAHTHVRLYKNIFDELGLSLDESMLSDELNWQALEGYNLLMRHVINRKNYFKSLGSLAITELADPQQYERFVAGCKRVGLGENSQLLQYYEEHISVDTIHGDGWLNNVILPLITKYPEAKQDIIFGCYVRLNTSKAYWDSLYQKLLAQESSTSAIQYTPSGEALILS
ncbi:iron-containing redox enzyme family protein [Pseudoalteromonas piscicida]